MSCIRIRKLLLPPRISTSGLAGATCHRAVEHLPRVTRGAYLPRTDPHVNLVGRVWRFSDGASQIGERGCLEVLLPRGVEDHDARGTGMHVFFIFLSEMVRPYALKTSAKTAIIRSNPCSNRGTMHALSAYSTSRIARRAHSRAVSGPTLNGRS